MAEAWLRRARDSGKAEDVGHGLHDLEGALYGSVVLFMKRPVPPAAQRTAKVEGGEPSSS